jgi:hypothetical protein
MRALRFGFAAIIVAVLPILAATPAHAALTGPCDANGSVTGQPTPYEAKTTDRVTIPRKGDVHWQGKVDSPSTGKRQIDGFVELALPVPFGSAKLGTWGKQSDTYANSGDYKYDLPSVLEGFDIYLSGQHHESGVNCAGHVTIRIAGGGIGNPAAIASLVFTVVSTTLLVVSGRGKVART